VSSKRRIIPIFVPHRGCPNDCFFCNQKRITNCYDDLSVDRIKRETGEKINAPYNIGKELELAYYGGSFTAIEPSLRVELLKFAKELKENNQIKQFRISTRPDAVDSEIIRELKDYYVDTVEIGVQSTNDNVLKLINRGHTYQDIIRASIMIRENGLRLGHQVMPGLYGSNFNKDIQTVRDSIKLRPEITRIYPTLVLKDTMFETLHANKDFNPLSLEESIKQVAVLYCMYRYHGVEVIRMGLQPTEEINYDKAVIAGPFHPAFKQMVLTNIYVTALVHRMKSASNESWSISCNESLYNIIAGQKKNGLILLKKHLNIKRIAFILNNSALDGMISIKTDNETYLLYETELMNTFYEKNAAVWMKDV